MKRPKLRNKFAKERIIKKLPRLQTATKILFKSFEKSKMRHFNNLNVKDVTENKRFWKTIKNIFFTDKTKKQ